MQSPSNLFKPPAQIRPRSSHRDNSQTAAFSSETTVGKSYRPFTPEEAKNARIRYSLFEHLYGGYNLHHDYLRHNKLLAKIEILS